MIATSLFENGRYLARTQPVARDSDRPGVRFRTVSRRLHRRPAHRLGVLLQGRRCSGRHVLGDRDRHGSDLVDQVGLIPVHAHLARR